MQWLGAAQFVDVTVVIGEDQATYVPVEEGQLFLAMKAQSLTSATIPSRCGSRKDQSI